MMIPKSVHEKRKQHKAFSSDRVNTRLAMKTDRPDIWSYILQHTDSNKELKGLSLEQMYSNSSTFMIAGTETTATQLAGLSYQLLINPKIMERLTHEIRNAFGRREAITMQSLAQLEYLSACLEEGLRFYPPVPVGTPRVTPDPGATVCGHFVPAGVCTIQRAISNPQLTYSAQKDDCFGSTLQRLSLVFQFPPSGRIPS